MYLNPMLTGGFQMSDKVQDREEQLRHQFVVAEDLANRAFERAQEVEAREGDTPRTRRAYGQAAEADRHMHEAFAAYVREVARNTRD
jgi:hypothetical protein